MVILTEKMVLSRARTASLQAVQHLNCWGSDLSDVRSFTGGLFSSRVCLLSVAGLRTGARVLTPPSKR